MCNSQFKYWTTIYTVKMCRNETETLWDGQTDRLSSAVFCNQSIILLCHSEFICISTCLTILHIVAVTEERTCFVILMAHAAVMSSHKRQGLITKYTSGVDCLLPFQYVAQYFCLPRQCINIRLF
jgi:hypothetical protein